MAYVDKMHSLTLAIREVVYRFEHHKADCFETEEIMNCVAKLKDLLWEHKPFWEEVGIATGWAFAHEEDTFEDRLQHVESQIEWISHLDQYIIKDKKE